MPQAWVGEGVQDEPTPHEHHSLYTRKTEQLCSCGEPLYGFGESNALACHACGALRWLV